MRTRSSGSGFSTAGRLIARRESATGRHEKAGRPPNPPAPTVLIENQRSGSRCRFLLGFIQGRQLQGENAGFGVNGDVQFVTVLGSQLREITATDQAAAILGDTGHVAKAATGPAVASGLGANTNAGRGFNDGLVHRGVAERLGAVLFSLDVAGGAGQLVFGHVAEFLDFVEQGLPRQTGHEACGETTRE